MPAALPALEEVGNDDIIVYDVVSLSCFSVYVAFSPLSCGDLVERTRVCGITVHSAASDRR